MSYGWVINPRLRLGKKTPVATDNISDFDAADFEGARWRLYPSSAQVFIEARLASEFKIV